MLQRAASNAYSWWWASHVRTKQSKWLQQSLEDMEERVNETLNIIAHDGDSFAKRAEMYYRKRPEIINFLEESFKAYRSLAEKYDHLSRELQNANRTIAQVFPERVQFALDEEDENSAEAPSETPRNVPKTPRKDTRSPPFMRRNGLVTVPRSGLSKAQALEEIDKLQKGILGLQTEKEYVRNTYKNAANNYWDMENQITEMQEKVYSLQDEYGIGTVIEDGEARSLMVTTALKSCQETLQKLQEKHEQTFEDAKTERKRIKEIYNQLEALKVEFLTKYSDEQKERAKINPEYSDAKKVSPERTSPDLQHQVTNTPQDNCQDLEMPRDLIKAKTAASSDTNLSVLELAEKIDELVTKVLKLETSVISHDTLVQRLTSETDELKGHMRELQGDMENLTQSREIIGKRIEELEEELCRVTSLNQTIEDQNTNLQTKLKEANGDIKDLSEQMHTVKLDEDLENAGLFKEVKEAPDTIAAKEIKKHKERMLAVRDNLKTTTTEEKRKKDDDMYSGDPEKSSEITQEKVHGKDCCSCRDLDSELPKEDAGEEVVPTWRLLYLSTLDDKERNLLEEYTSVLQNYKDVRRKLNDVEERNRENVHDLTIQIRELEKSNAMMEAHILALHQQLDTQQIHQQDHSPATASSPGYFYSPLEIPIESTSKADGSPISTISSLGIIEQHQDNHTSSSQDVIRNDELDASTNFTDIPEYDKQNEIEVKDIGECNAILSFQKKIQTEIDQLLEDNLEFWLRFSNSIQQRRKFQATIQDLKAELSKIRDKNKPLSSDAKPIYRHLREIHTELKLWLEQSAVLKEEVQSRFSSLSHLQDEISGSRGGSGKLEDIILTDNQVAKFHGEVLNMKQENMKIEEELQTGLERVKALQIEVGNLLEKLDAELGMSSPKDTPQPSHARIPLRSFLFGVKLKKQKKKRSIFSCVNPSPQNLRSPTPRRL